MATRLLVMWTVSGADYGNKGVSAGNQEPVIEADHGHKAVSDVDHQPVSEAVHHGHKAFIGEEHLGQKALSSVNLHHLGEGHHGHNAGVGHECTSLGLYQDSGGLEAVWQDLCQAAESSNNLCSQATDGYLDKGAMYQDSGGHGTTSQELNHASYDGIYLAAKAAHFLATIAKPVYVDSSQDLASDTVNVDDTHDIECHGWAHVEGLEENGVGTLLGTLLWRGVAVNHLLREGSFSPGLTGFSTYNMNPTEEVLGEGGGLPYAQDKDKIGGV